MAADRVHRLPPPTPNLGPPVPRQPWASDVNAMHGSGHVPRQLGHGNEGPHGGIPGSLLPRGAHQGRYGIRGRPRSGQGTREHGLELAPLPWIEIADVIGGER